ncbi:hypothetical protein E2C01_032902 [Portunus trituberculatus]|uniref:Uncharacterized protein n=1 Tax=Portunus trituberculatus TaxID=210409 RepID=A0A5B7F1K7_PORTR|nr:hypothetical protein [Portunus trituberculatus]
MVEIKNLYDDYFASLFNTKYDTDPNQKSILNTTPTTTTTIKITTTQYHNNHHNDTISPTSTTPPTLHEST